MLKENGRLWLLNASKTEIREPVIDGEKNLSDGPCVVASTHFTGIDPREIARVLGNSRKVALAVRQSSLESRWLGPWFHLLGRGNFLPISNSTAGGHISYSLKTEDIRALKECVNEKERTVVISAYTPTENWHMPEKGGIGAAVLAHAADVQLVPAAMTYESPEVVAHGLDLPKRAANILLNRRSATSISFCPPVDLVSLSSDEINLAMSLYDRTERKKLSDKQKGNAREVLTILKGETAAMMAALASKLPEAAAHNRG